jgi:hypothetical protein
MAARDARGGRDWVCVGFFLAGRASVVLERVRVVVDWVPKEWNEDEK